MDAPGVNLINHIQHCSSRRRRGAGDGLGACVAARMESGACQSCVRRSFARRAHAYPSSSPRRRRRDTAEGYWYMGRAYGHDSGQGRGFETSRPVFSVLRRTLSSASISVSTVWRTASARARGRHAFRVASVTSNAWETRPSAPVWKSKFYGAFVLNHRVVGRRAGLFPHSSTRFSFGGGGGAYGSSQSES